MAKLKNIKPKKGLSPTNGTNKLHIASLEQARDFWHYHQKQLPNADLVLRRIGWDLSRLKQFILSDIQIQTTWNNTRLPFLTGTPCQITAIDQHSKTIQAADSFRENLNQLDMHNIIEQLMDAVSLGYSVAEILWHNKNKNWKIQSIVPKPSYWFRFNAMDELLFLSKHKFDGEVMPEPNFLVLRHRASYDNPYGESLFSKLYWPVLFKKHGLEWWVKFIERFGSLSYFGKYDLNTSVQQQNELLNALLELQSSSVAIGPDGTTIESVGDKQREQGSTVHKDFSDWLDKAIAKAVLGQNLSSDSGDKGTQALGNIQFKILEAIAKSDQRLISSAFNRLARRYTDYNFGQEVPAPIFAFEQKEDLKLGRAERDQKLYGLGWRPQPEYIAQNYNIPQEQFTLGDTGAASGATPSADFADANFTKATSELYQFSAKQGSDQLQQQFAEQLAGSGQQILDDIQDQYFGIIKKQSDFEGALNALSKPNKKQKRSHSRQLGKFACVIDSLRHTSHNLGSRDGGGDATP